ncbi:hypothetical protein [Pseudanabaena sp. BC1403]|uniref:hypothetical protein n=1 Tax=Pseudanabaena sp. BC1403 TaxID=2043171 RepID=UPI000CD8AA22|nr:hypothetical protein [Pseudanabaena sp. BC1403]
MTETNRLIYPTIDLFVYDLAEGLGQSDERVEQNRENFWRRIYGKKLTVQQLEAASQIELENSDCIELLATERCQDFINPLDGYYYPVKLGDTYALQVNCSSDREDTVLEDEPRDIKNFSQIQQNILSNLHCQNKASNHIGQTWFAWAQLTSVTQDPTTTAKQIYTQLQIFDHPDWEKDLKTELKTTEVKLLGANCYELWQLPSDRGDLSQSKHLLISLFPHELSLDTIDSKISNLYPSLMRLFLYRHKIIWAYDLSRQSKARLKKDAKHIQIAITDDSTKTDLVALQQDLKSTLNLMTTYAEELIYLEDQKNTIETNLKNYQKQLQQFEEPKQDIDQPFLEKFTVIVTDKYLPQITADLASLSPAQKSLENSVRNIEGIINIEQAKSDRNLNQTIFAVGTGLGTSQVAASIIVAQFPANLIPTKSDTHFLIYMGAVFFGSIIIGIFFGGVIWLKLRSRNSKNP